MRSDAPFRGILFLLASGVVFTFLDALAKHTALIVPVLQVAWGRHVFHFIFLPLYGDHPFARASWSPDGWQRLFATRHPWLQILRSLLLLAATLFFFGAVDGDRRLDLVRRLAGGQHLGRHRAHRRLRSLCPAPRTRAGARARANFLQVEFFLRS